MLRTSEIFGPTVQGEGRFAGYPAIFVRLSGCNLDCSWCDTPYTWDWTGKNGTVYIRSEEEFNPSDEQLLSEVEQILTNSDQRIIISGGEPLLQSKGIRAFHSMIRKAGLNNPIDIETNGTVKPIDDLNTEIISHYTVSPKFGSSGIEWRPRWDKTIEQFRNLALVGKADCKFVISDQQDVECVEEFINKFSFPTQNIYIMPEGKTSRELERSAGLVADTAINLNVKYSDRLHVRIWEDERKR